VEGIEEFILHDVLGIATLALLLGLVVHRFLRRLNPERNWGSLGNVWTQPFGVGDLPVLGLLLYFIFLSLPSAGSGEEVELGSQAVWTGVIFWMLILAALILFLGFVRGINVSEVFGFARLGPLRVMGLSALAMLIVFPLVYFTEKGNPLLFHEWVNEFDRQNAVKALASSDDLGFKIAMIFSACLVAPVAEEVLFRGYVYATVKRFTDRSFSAVFTSTVFAVMHLNVLSLAPLWVLALCLTIAYEMTGCIWVPIAMHAIFNSVSMAVLLISSPGR